MKKKFSILSPVLVGALTAGYVLTNCRVGDQTVWDFLNPPAIVQTDSPKDESALPDWYTPNKGVAVENDFSYHADDIWYNRMRALEALARTPVAEAVTQETLLDLEAIAAGDDDPRISELAYWMIKSYTLHGDFSDTWPYKEMLAENERLTIHTTTDFGYHAKDIWYQRMDAIEDLVRRPAKITSDLITDLQIIAQREDDSRIRELAHTMVTSYYKDGTFKAAESIVDWSDD